MTDTIIVYHDNCHDGVTAAAIAHRALARPPESAEIPSEHPDLYPATYGAPPDLDRLRGKVVYILDFSWKRPDMDRIAEVAQVVYVYDHHESAERELAGYAEAYDHVNVVFDIGRSGAGITWDELVGGSRPDYVRLVEDRDLWRFKFGHTKAYHAACGSYPLTVAMRHQLISRPVLQLFGEGEAILRFQEQVVSQIAKRARRLSAPWPFSTMGVEVGDYAFVSDVGHAILDGNSTVEVALLWVREADELHFSLRSRKDGPNVSVIAAQFGGGGHACAAGFKSRAPLILDLNLFVGVSRGDE